MKGKEQFEKLINTATNSKNKNVMFPQHFDINQPSYGIRNKIKSTNVYMAWHEDNLTWDIM